MIDAVEHGLRRAGQGLVAALPAAEAPLMRARGRYAAARVRLRVARQNLVHDAEIDPFRILRVDPDAIVRTAEVWEEPKYSLAGRVRGGDWDDSDVYFEDLDVYRAFEAHFERGVPWSETAFYDRVVAELDDGHEQWGCTSRAEFDRRCDRLDRLYETIRDDGYRSQVELLQLGGQVSIGKTRYTWTDRILEDEMAVSVGRDGDLLFFDGRNRLCIAKLLGLDEVPVVVMVRHAEWQSLRDAVARDDHERADVDASLTNHPDVEYL